RPPGSRERARAHPRTPVAGPVALSPGTQASPPAGHNAGPRPCHARPASPDALTALPRRGQPSNPRTRTLRPAPARFGLVRPARLEIADRYDAGQLVLHGDRAL